MHVLDICNVYDTKRGILPFEHTHTHTHTAAKLFQRSRNCSLAALDIVIASRQTDGKHRRILVKRIGAFIEIEIDSESGYLDKNPWWE